MYQLTPSQLFRKLLENDHNWNSALDHVADRFDMRSGDKDSFDWDMRSIFSPPTQTELIPDYLEN